MSVGIVSKNQRPGQRGKGIKRRMFDGEEVKPVLFYGRDTGHGKYMSGSINDNIIVDDNGRPIPLRNIGELLTADQIVPVEEKAA